MNSRKLGLTAGCLAASAVLLTVIQPPLGFSFLAWVAWVPFVLVCAADMPRRSLGVFAYLISLVYWLGNLYWLVPATMAGWLAFCFYQAFLWPIMAFCLRWCFKKKISLLLSLPVLVVGFERLQGMFLGGFFWRFLGHSQYANTTLIQFSDILGAGGVSFLVALVNGLVADSILAYRDKRLFSPRQPAKAAIAGSLVVLAVIYGRWRLRQTPQFVEAGPMAAAVQTNIPQSVKETYQAGWQIYDDLEAQSELAIEAGAELVIWPETMVQATLNKAILRIIGPDSNPRRFHKAISEHAEGGAYVLVGAYAGTPRITENSKIKLIEKFNTAYLYDDQGRQVDLRYDKIHLVPFGEVMPFKKSAPWLYSVLMWFTPYDYDYSLDYGSEYTVFELEPEQQDRSGPYRFGVLICYEDTVPAISRRFTAGEEGRKRIDWLVNISNDGWFVRFDNGQVKPSAELPQHAAVCVFRAVENRLAIIRSVNTGISCLIDSAGRIRDGFADGNLPKKAMSRTGVEGWFMDRIPIDSRTTFFSKYGPVLDFCCTGSVLLLIIGAICTKILRTGKRIRLSRSSK